VTLRPIAGPAGQTRQRGLAGRPIVPDGRAGKDTTDGTCLAAASAFWHRTSCYT